MKFTILLAQVGACVLASLSSAGERNGNGPGTTANLVAKTVAWQVHWDNKVGIPTKVPSTLSLRMHGQSEAWVSGIDWVIAFAYEREQPFPNFVQRLPGLPDEVRQRAMLPFARAPQVKVELPSYTSSFHRINTIEPSVRQRLLDAFKREACRTDILALCKDEAGRWVTNVRFWIAPVDLSFPVILYYVEGVPYIGRVYFDTRSLTAVYVDFDYIGDKGTGSRDSDEKRMKGIKAEGDQFELQNGRLTPIAH